MQAKSSTTPSSMPLTTPATTAAPARVAPSRQSRRQRSLQLWNRVAWASLGVILLYMVGCLALVQAPVDQPELPGLLAGFGLAPLIGLLFAYLLTRAELTRR